MKWYYLVLLVCVIIAPFDALYMYIKSVRRRDALKRRKPVMKKEAGHQDKEETEEPPSGRE